LKEQASAIFRLLSGYPLSEHDADLQFCAEIKNIFEIIYKFKTASHFGSSFKYKN